MRGKGGVVSESEETGIGGVSAWACTEEAKAEGEAEPSASGEVSSNVCSTDTSDTGNHSLMVGFHTVSSPVKPPEL
jgi:hypothetical protein